LTEGDVPIWTATNLAKQVLSSGHWELFGIWFLVLGFSLVFINLPIQAKAASPYSVKPGSISPLPAQGSQPFSQHRIADL
jgi:hypothetical protein